MKSLPLTRVKICPFCKSNTLSKKAKIEIEVQFNEEKLPSHIYWNATDQVKGDQSMESKALFLFLFDRAEKETLKIDLWTHDFEVQEMDRMVFHTIRSIADTYIRATNNRELAESMQQFAAYFGEQTGIIPTV